MLDLEKSTNEKIEFYQQPHLIQDPRHPAGFSGVWAFEEHSKIPQVLRSYLQRHFGVLRLTTVAINNINQHLNSVWDGPGSLSKLMAMEYELQLQNTPVKVLPGDAGRMDWDDTGAPVSQVGAEDAE